MDALFSWLFHDYWHSQYFLIVLGLGALQGGVSALYWFVRTRLDAAHPDDLPLMAGQFAVESAARLELPVEVFAVAGDKAQNLYSPSGRFITLTADLFVKRDPTCWATAAHEIGHAILYQRWHALAVPLGLAQASIDTSRLFVSTALLLNLAYTSKVLSDVAFALILATIALYLLVLTDELLASVFAMRLLRQDGRLTSARLASARQVLFAAFLTYAVGLAGQVGLLVLWRELGALAQTQTFVPAAPLSGQTQWLAVLLALWVIGSAVTGLLRLGRSGAPPKNLAEMQREKLRAFGAGLVRGVPILLLLWLVWDQPFGPWMPLLCLLAVKEAWLVVVMMLLPVLLLAAVPLGIIALTGVWIVIGTTGLGATMKRDPREVAQDKAVQAQVVQESAPRLIEAVLASRTPLMWLGQTLSLVAPLPLAGAVLWFGAS